MITIKTRTPTRNRSLVPWTVAAVAMVAVAGVATAVMINRPEVVTATIPSGTTVVGRLANSVSTESARVGDRIELIIPDSIETKGGPAVPAGAKLIGEVTHAKGGGRVAGAPELTIRVTTLEAGGDQLPMTATPLRFKGKDDALESVAEIGGGTVVGAVVGQVLGKKPVEGAVVGAAAGTVVAVATKGDQIVLPAGTRLRIRLTDPATVTFRPESELPGKR
ncbi:MAG: hypothetical protein AB7S39_06535 [Gemmatimonadales bacterium]